MENGKKNLSEAKEKEALNLATNNIEKIKTIIEKDQNLAKNMLARLSGTEVSKQADASIEFDFIDNLTKPSWVENVKKIQKNIITPDVKKKEIPEKTKPQSKDAGQNGTSLDREREEEKEEYKEYPFYSLIKKIMYANGDSRRVKKESVIAMHTFVVKVVNTVFDKQLLAKYFEPDKKHERAGDKTQRHKALKLKKLLSKLYSQEYFKFFQFNKIAKNVEKLDYDLEKDNEAADESKLFNYESENDSDDGLSFKLINCNIRDEEKSHFNHKRMEAMKEEEYLYFVSCRSTNFLSDGKDKLVTFLDLENRGLGFLGRNKNMIEFIAYILCRIVGNTVENIIRHTNHGTLALLNEPLDAEQIAVEAEKHLTSLKFQTKKVIKDSLSIEEIAFKLFLKECKENESPDNTTVSEPVKQVKKEMKSATKTPKASLQKSPQAQEGKQSLKTQWKRLGATVRKQWTDRVIAEKQIKELVENPLEENINWDDIDPINSYAEFLINHLREVKTKDQVNENVFKELFRRFQNNEGAPIVTFATQAQQNLNGKNMVPVIESGSQQQQQNVAKGSEEPQKQQLNRKRRLESIFG